MDGFQFYLPLDVSSVAAFATTDDSRPVLAGLHVNVVQNRVEATDTYRMAWMDLPENTFPDEASNVVIPAKAINDVVSFAKSKSARLVGIEVEVRPEHGVNLSVMGRNGRVTLSTELIDAVFPDIGGMIPASAPEQFAAINPDYLATTAKAMLNKDNGFVFMGITGKLNPVIFAGKSPGGTPFRSLVMPMVPSGNEFAFADFSMGEDEDTSEITDDEASSVQEEE
jgi:DNA polymerase III sliding clamp (beta) subunit (PCNA family)